MKKAISVLCAAMILLANTVVISANADYVPVNAAVSSDAGIQATGLITYCYLEVSNSNGKLCINGSTKALTAMKSIGFKNIKIEQSSNGSTWTPYSSLDDVLASEAYSCSFNNYTVSVTKGYYYRVTCTHYAKATGLFGSSQSVSNTSNSVKIS